MRARLSIISLLSVALLFGACSSTEKPDPSETLVGKPIGNDSLSPEDISTFGGGFNQDGSLTQRGAGFDGQQYRDILQPVYFGFDQSNVSAVEAPKLQQAAAFMLQNPNDKLIIEGHCDWRGTSEYNLALGERRAQSVRQFLENLGVPAHRMQTNSKGDEEATTSGTAEQMANDRRADLIVVR
jgi:peptidoglycan-associated lipoprotein